MEEKKATEVRAPPKSMAIDPHMQVVLKNTRVVKRRHIKVRTWQQDASTAIAVVLIAVVGYIHPWLLLSLSLLALALYLLHFGGWEPITYLKSIEKQRKLQRQRPKRIILIRHGESMGNVDATTYAETPDHKVPLTAEGVRQAKEAGAELRQLIGNEMARFFVSPYRRSYQTFEGILEGAKLTKDKYTFREEPRLREQDWGNFQIPDKVRLCMEARRHFGSFYYRFPEGESAADVYDRVTDFWGSLHREFKFAGCLDNFVLVSHGITLRVFLMRYLKWTVDEYHKLWNFDNCSLIVMELQPNGQYKLMTKIKQSCPPTSPVIEKPI